MGAVSTATAPAAASVVADVAADRGKAVAAAIRESGGQATFAELDVTSVTSWSALLEGIRREFGALHVLVNNAGIVSRSAVSGIALDEWQRVIDVNLTGPMLGIQASAPLMRDSGGGAIVNVGTMTTRKPMQGEGGYAVAKAATEPTEVLVQVSIDGDETRGGHPIGDLPRLADHVARSSELILRGVMTVAPLGMSPQQAFAALYEAVTRLRVDHPDATVISAGMSGDLEDAIAHGSTCVRVGTALLGSRRLASP